MNIITKIFTKIFAPNKNSQPDKDTKLLNMYYDNLDNKYRISELEVEVKGSKQYDHSDLYDHTIVSAWIYNKDTNEVLLHYKDGKYNLPNGKSNPNESPYLSIKRIMNESFNVLVKKSKQVNKFNKTYIRKDNENMEHVVKTIQYSYYIINYMGQLYYNNNEFKYVNLNDIDVSVSDDQLKKSINHFKKTLEKVSKDEK